MPDPKQPQDHQAKKPKAVEPEAAQEDKSDLFTFTHQGDEFTLPLAAVDHVTVGLYRRNRHMDDAEFAMMVWELLADGQQDVLDVLDRGGREALTETQRVMTEFREYLGAPLGE